MRNLTSPTMTIARALEIQPTIFYSFLRWRTKKLQLITEAQVYPAVPTQRSVTSCLSLLLGSR